VATQVYGPELVVVVNDGRALPEPACAALRVAVGDQRLVVLPNSRTPGPAGAWNTALEYLAEIDFNGFVALLDDDDEWDPGHLQENALRADRANIVVSGLRRVVAGAPLPRPLIGRLRVEGFLAGNPGWQGSNTFVQFGLLREAGSFREGLASLHDRDLAIRLLEHPRAVPAVVPRWTATWYLDTRSSLSAPRSLAKLRGLRFFWSLYHGRMSEEVRGAYFRRAERLFGFTQAEILAEAELSPVATWGCDEPAP